MLDIAIIPSNVPTPVALTVGIIGLGAGMIWARAAARDQIAAAHRLSASTATYYVRAETARNQIWAIESPTQAMDLTQLRHATATRRERLAEWAHEQVARAHESVRPERGPRDWEPGEMTAAFRRIVDQHDDWLADEPTLALPAPAPVFAELYGNPSPVAPPRHELPAPPPTPAPALLVAPRGPQTPPRWEDRPAPPRRSRTLQVVARTRAWRGPLLGLAVPPLELPALPAPFHMPQPRRRPTPALMAQLPEDPTRAWRTRTV